MAIDPITGEVVPDNGRTTQGAGYQARQLDKREDVALDRSWRQRGMAVPRTESAADYLGDVQGRDQAETLRALEARRKIAAILAEDEAPRRGSARVDDAFRVPKRSGGLSLDDLRDGITRKDYAMAQADLRGLRAEDRVALGLSTGNLKQVVLEEELNSPVGGSWTPQRAMAKLKDGTRVPVWLVRDSRTGMELKKPFRLEEAADRACAILNQSGNVNDPRLKKLIETYDRYIRLTKKIRSTKKLIREGHRDQKPVLRRLQSELQRVSLKLGV